MSTTKRIYVVRHGETDANLRNHSQGPDSELNEQGLKQAEKIAARVANLDIDFMVASDFRRARQTAEVILATKTLPHEFSPLFREVVAPSSVIGMDPDSAVVKDYRAARAENAHDPSWHYEDEENFHERTERTAAAKRFLEEKPEDDILVVTHGHFLKNFIGHILLGDLCTPAIQDRFYRNMLSANTGLTLFLVEDSSWQLLTWNDHSHLG